MGRVRGQRLGELMKQELSDLLHRSIKDPRIGFITVTAVEMSGDLQIAKIYVSVLGTEEEKAEALVALEKAKGFLRSEIGNRLSVRRTPELDFVPDTSLAHSERIEDLLKNLPPASLPAEGKGE